jgi:hypothetical protein
VSNQPEVCVALSVNWFQKYSWCEGPFFLPPVPSRFLRCTRCHRECRPPCATCRFPWTGQWQSTTQFLPVRLQLYDLA